MKLNIQNNIDYPFQDYLYQLLAEPHQKHIAFMSNQPTKASTLAVSSKLPTSGSSQFKST
jgi:hypothetical protein